MVTCFFVFEILKQFDYPVSSHFPRVLFISFVAFCYVVRVLWSCVVLNVKNLMTCQSVIVRIDMKSSCVVWRHFE